MSFLLITVWFSVVCFCCEKQFLIDLGQMSKIHREEIVFSSLVLWMKEWESCSSAVRPHSTISWSFCLCWREITVSVWGFNINDDDAQIPFSYPSSQPSIFGIHSFLGSKLEVLNCFFFVETFSFFHFWKNFADDFHDFKWVIVFEYDTTYFLPTNFDSVFVSFPHTNLEHFYPLKVSLKDSH